MSDHRRSRGFVTIETLLVSLGLSLALAEVGPFAPPASVAEADAARMGEAERDAWRLRFAAEVQWTDTGRCPTTASLLTAGEFRAERDPWDKPYWVFCQGSEVTVVSDGPDGAPFTADDVGSRSVPWATQAPRAARSFGPGHHRRIHHRRGGT